MTTLLDRATYTADWTHWRHHRQAAASAPHGLAALTGTHWLDTVPAAIEGLPGLWSAEGRAVRGRGLGPDLRIEVGSRTTWKELELAAVERSGRVALRVFDPAADTRLALVGISAFEPDEHWARPGRFVPGPRPVEVRHVDGVSSEGRAAGVVQLDLAAGPVELVAFPAAEGGLQISFADAGNGSASQQFRFLTLHAPGLDNGVVVDFNRAYLPPCAFAPHYLCPLPPAQNRLPFAVEAGERFVVLVAGVGRD